MHGPPIPESERDVVGRTLFAAITARLARSRLPVVPLLTFRSAEKRDFLRDHLHNLMPGSFSILVFTGLNTPLNRYEALSAAAIYAQLMF